MSGAAYSTDYLRSLIQRDRIAPEVYADPAIFELEMSRIFGRTWQLVGHESQIPRTGDYFTSRVGRQDVIVVRDQDRRVRVLHNQCSHRGAHLCSRPSGHLARLICPYHAWTFNLDGALLGVPLAEEYGADELKGGALGLRTVAAVDSYRGFIFARASADGPALEEFLGPLHRAFDDLVDRSPCGELVPVAGVIRHRFRANWKMMFENLNDVFHAAFAHASAAAALRQVAEPARLHPVLRSLTGVPDMLKSFQKFRMTTTPHGHSFASGLISASQRPPRSAHFEALAAVHGEERAAQILGTDMHLVLIYPSGNINASQQTVRIVRPIAVDETEVWGFCFRLKDAPEETARSALVYCNVATSAFSPVVADDLEIYERAQRNLAAGGRGTWCSRAAAAGDGAEVPATSEAYIRNQYRAWLGLICAEESEVGERCAS